MKERVCESCRGTERVISVDLQVRYSRLRPSRVPTVHICEGCLLAAPVLARAITERGRTSALTLISGGLELAYAKLRGAA